MAITRTAWIDDDGSATTGTIINNAEKTILYNQIDAALAGPGWVDAPVGAVSDDAGTILTSSIVFSRSVRLTPTTLVWAFRSDLFTCPVATANIWLSYLPFTSSNTNARNPVGWSSTPMYLRVYPSGANRFQLTKIDGTNHAIGSYFAAFTTVWEVAP